MPTSNTYSRPIRHIQREDLYTNLEMRIQYLHSFLDFSGRTFSLVQTQFSKTH